MDNGESSYRRFLAGDENVFVEIVDTHRESLIFFLYRLTGDLNAAEDLAEDVFVEVLLHPGRYRFQCALKTWLFTIGRNKSVSFLRKTSRLHLVPPDEAGRLAETADCADAAGLEAAVLNRCGAPVPQNRKTESSVPSTAQASDDRVLYRSEIPSVPLPIGSVRPAVLY